MNNITCMETKASCEKPDARYTSCFLIITPTNVQ